MGISDGVAAILRHKIQIIVCVILTIAAVVAFSMTKPPVFQTEARLVLEGSTFENGILGEFSALSQTPPAVQQVEILRSRKLARFVVTHPDTEDLPDFARGLGLGLSVTVDDLDKHWPRATMKRRLFRTPHPLGGLRVELPRPYVDTAITVLNLVFLTDDSVRISTANGFDELSQDYKLDGPRTEVEFYGRRLLLIPDGELAGRTFRITLRGVRAAIDDMLSRLIVRETQRGSGVIQILYSDTDPNRAQRLVNGLAEIYVAYKRDRVSRRAGATMTFIDREIGRVDKELEEAEDALIAYQEESGATLLSENGLALVDQITGLDLERARLSMSIGAHREVMRQLELDEIPVESIVGSIQVSPLAESLFRNLVTAQAAVRELEVEYTDAWPELIKAKEQVEELRASIRLHLDAQFKGLQSQDQNLAGIVARYEAELAQLPRTEREVAKLQRKATSAETVYLLLLGQLQEAKIIQAATLEEIEIIDEALPPRIRSQPDVRVNLALGGLFGIFLGIVLALIQESMTRRIRTAAQLEGATRLSVFGTIPDFRRGLARSRRARSKVFLALIDDPESSASEAYRALRSSLQFASKGQTLKSLAITSAAQGEGKSTTTADLAIALAQGGKRVLLVDADLRRPVVHKFFERAIAPGLSEVLQGNAESEESLRDTPIPNLTIVTAGSAVKNPSDLLASAELAELSRTWAEQFDHVLYDVPPVLAVSDASSFLHNLDAIFLLCRSDLLPENVVEQATRRLRMSGAPLLGAILNGHRPSRLARDYSSYGYGYGYSYSAEAGKRD